MRRRPIWPLSLIALLLVLGGILYLQTRKEKSSGTSHVASDQTRQPGAETAIERIPVKTWLVQKRDLEVTLPVFGAINYLEKVDVAAEKTLYEVLKEVPVQVGDLVHPGQVVAVMDTDLLRVELDAKNAMLSQAQAQLNLLAWQYQANRKLHGVGGISLNDFEESEANYRAKQAEVKRFQAEATQTRLQIKKATIRSPIAGIVGQKNYNLGERIPNQSDKGVVTVMRIDEVYVDAEVSERDLARLRPGLEVAVISDAYPKSRLYGKLDRLEPVLKEQSRTAVAKVRVPNPELLLKPGMFTRMEIILDKVPQVVAVPTQALRQAPDKSWQVFGISDEVAFVRKVTVGLTTENWSEIKSGLEPGEAVVVEGSDRLKELSRVISTPAALPLTQ